MTLHSGSCHCGAVAFEVETELEGLIECNCTHCYRKGLILAFATPEAFRLTRGEDQLGEYLFNRHVIRHRFCRACGVEVMGEGNGPDGQPMIAVNVRTLEGVEPWSVETIRYDGLAQL